MRNLPNSSYRFRNNLSQILQILCHCRYVVLLWHITPLRNFRGVIILWTKWRYEISKFQTFHSLCSFIFLKIMHHSSMPWQITVETLVRARTWTVNSSVKLQYNSCPALASTALPYPSLHCFVQSTLRHFALLCYIYLPCYYYIRTWSINWWNIQQICGNLLNFIAFFGRYMPPATVQFTPSFLWKGNVLQGGTYAK